MGQRDRYLASDSHWHSSLTRDERLHRWWSSASFGVALSGKAARALAASDRGVAVAEVAREMVQHQAVYALLDEGYSVREIADQLGFSKSKVGRMVKGMMRDGQIANVTFFPPRDASDETRALVLAAWRFSDLANSTRDHPRGTHEAVQWQEPTNFGGLNDGHR